MIRATQGVNHGTWYYEVTIAEMPPESATRIGWSQALGWWHVLQSCFLQDLWKNNIEV